MNSKQMMDAILSGKKIRRKEWGDSEYVYYDGETFKTSFNKYYYLDLKKHGMYEYFAAPELCIVAENVGKSIRLLDFAKKILSWKF